MAVIDWVESTFKRGPGAALAHLRGGVSTQCSPRAHENQNNTAVYLFFYQGLHPGAPQLSGQPPRAPGCFCILCLVGGVLYVLFEVVGFFLWFRVFLCCFLWPCAFLSLGVFFCLVLLVFLVVGLFFKRVWRKVNHVLYVVGCGLWVVGCGLWVVVCVLCLVSCVLCVVCDVGCWFLILGSVF